MTAHVDEPASAPVDADLFGLPASEGPRSSGVVRLLVGLLGNVAVLTALLVYFGWRRAETQAHEVGIDESILGMSTRDYVLRSVGPVLVLLTALAVGGLIWMALDEPFTRWVSQRPASRARRVAFAMLSLAWLLLPLAVILLGYPLPTLAYVAFPASIGTGILLNRYGRRLRDQLDGRKLTARSRRRQTITAALTALLAGVTLFWTASNYAEVLGESLADRFRDDIDELVGVVVYSEERLGIDAPGAVEAELDGSDGDAFRYSGLRLMEHTGGTYFLVSDGWSDDYGVVVALSDSDPRLRLEFVNGRP